jgi:hypothetical protein
MVRIHSAVAFILCSLASTAASGVVVPAGLSPGDQYYLTFVTDGRRTGASADIADYNQFVQSQASLNPIVTGTDQGVQWRAVGSTGSVNGAQNLSLLDNIPIYLIDGTTVISQSATDWWSGSHDAPIDLDQYLNPVAANAIVGTGSLPNGSAANVSPNFNYFGNPITSSIRIGYAGASNSQWISAAVATGPSGSYAQFRLYAVSDVLTVPVPEPPGIVLSIFGFVWLAVRAYRTKCQN